MPPCHLTFFKVNHFFGINVTPGIIVLRSARQTSSSGSGQRQVQSQALQLYWNNQTCRFHHLVMSEDFSLVVKENWRINQSWTFFRYKKCVMMALQLCSRKLAGIKNWLLTPKSTFAHTHTKMLILKVVWIVWMFKLSATGLILVSKESSWLVLEFPR